MEEEEVKTASEQVLELADTYKLLDELGGGQGGVNLARRPGGGMRRSSMGACEGYAGTGEGGVVTCSG